MISIYQLKPRFQQLLRPLVEFLFKHGMTANQVTLFAAIVSVLLGGLIACLTPSVAWFALLPLWMILRMALNAIDGMLAREFGQQSRLGAYLNEVCDVVADAALILPFACVAGVSIWLVILVTLLAFLTEYAGVLGLMVGATRRYDGPMGKSDRAFVLGTLALVLALGWAPPWFLNGVFGILVPLLAYTVINRVRQGLAATA